MNNFLTRMANFWLCLGRLYDVGISLIVSCLISLAFRVSSPFEFIIIFGICWLTLEFFWWSVNRFSSNMVNNPTLRKYFLGADFRKK